MMSAGPKVGGPPQTARTSEPCDVVFSRVGDELDGRPQFVPQAASHFS